jgi:hypothetical protein
MSLILPGDLAGRLEIIRLQKTEDLLQNVLVLHHLCSDVSSAAMPVLIDKKWSVNKLVK